MVPTARILPDVDASVIIVGDEILSGYVQDANTHFIATRVASHGHRVRRAVVVGDDPDCIAAEIRNEMAAGTALVFVCGGLGPTHDDRTMEGVAQALGEPLELCEPLAARLEELIARAGDAGIARSFGADDLRKMALAPRGAEALLCSIPWIPAVTIDHPRGRIVVLPGPPREMQRVFLETIEARFLEGTGEPASREEITHPFPESTLAKVLAELQAKYPATSIGSYPQGGHVLIRVSGPESDTRAVAETLRAHLVELLASEEGRRLLEYFGRRAPESP